MGGLKSNSVETRCQGATSAARALRPDLNFTGRLISYELEVSSTEEQARATIQSVLNTMKEQTVWTTQLHFSLLQFFRLNFPMTPVCARGVDRWVTCGS